MRGCNYSVVRGKNNGTRRNYTDKSCNFPLCREELLQPGWAAGEHICRGAQVHHPSFPRSLCQGTKQKLLPAGISLRKGVQGLQCRPGARGQEEMCCTTGALLGAQGPRMEAGSKPSSPFSCDL